MSKKTDEIIDNHIEELEKKIERLEKNAEYQADKYKKEHDQLEALDILVGYKDKLYIPFDGGDWCMDIPLIDLKKRFTDLVKEYAHEQFNG
mgnify:CR=1 FL=1